MSGFLGVKLSCGPKDEGKGSPALMSRASMAVRAAIARLTDDRKPVDGPGDESPIAGAGRSDARSPRVPDCINTRPRASRRSEEQPTRFAKPMATYCATVGGPSENGDTRDEEQIVTANGSALKDRRYLVTPNRGVDQSFYRRPERRHLYSYASRRCERSTRSDCVIRSPDKGNV